MTQLDQVMAKVRQENRAALIAYIPAGFPSQTGCAKAIQVLADAGVDAIEIGFPYSDPVMDGPVIQEAADVSIKAGTKAADVFAALKVAADTGVAAVVMTYWNPIAKYGVEESDEWIAATEKSGINPIYVVAPSTSNERLKNVTAKTGGFVYAASMMGVTGSRDAVSSTANELVSRVRTVTELPISVGLGVSTREQAKSLAAYADGVIVGSAFIKLLLDAPSEQAGLDAISHLAKELALGVREGR
jgi:tryptophan synthase alpha chain